LQLQESPTDIKGSGERFILAKFGYSFGIIIFGLTLGYILQILVNRKLIKLPIPIDGLRKLLQKIALLFLNPVAIVGAIWIVSIKNVGLIALPFVGLFALLTGGVLALGVARILRLAPKKTGAMFGCGSFTNIGAIGALVCFVFIGETGFALVPVLATSLAYLLGLGKIEGGLPLKVVIILSSMPVAFNALIPPSIYDLDLHLANSCWFFTTALLVIVLPALVFIINLV